MSTPKSSWRGTILFGKLPIGVELTSVCADEDSEFVTVHAADRGPVKQIKRCTKCAKDVDASECARAVEVAGEHVVVTEEELKACAPKSRSTIVLTQFVGAETIRPAFYDKAYYVEPTSGEYRDLQAHSILFGALGSHGLVAIGKVSFKTAERIAAIGVDEGRLMLYTLHYPGELRAVVQCPRVSVPQDLIAISVEVMESINRESGLSIEHEADLTRFSDDYSTRLAKLLRVKRGEVLTAPAGADLASVLAGSVKKPRRRKAA
jgi:DNA end-binding protein Ku